MFEVRDAEHSYIQLRIHGTIVLAIAETPTVQMRTGPPAQRIVAFTGNSEDHALAPPVCMLPAAALSILLGTASYQKPTSINKGSSISCRLALALQELSLGLAQTEPPMPGFLHGRSFADSSPPGRRGVARRILTRESRFSGA